MSKSMNIKEQSHGHVNADEKINSNSGEQKIEKTRFEDTPFVIVTTEEGCFVTLGKYRLSETFKEFGDAAKHIESKPWEMIMALVNIAISEAYKLNQILETLEEEINEKVETNS